MLRVTVVIGTRPEAIKMAPVIKALRQTPEFAVTVVSTGQHREMLAAALEVFGIVPDYDLDLMAPGQSGSDVLAAAIRGLAGVYAAVQPELVLVHGDTATALAGALAGYYARVPVGHVEAGLRTASIDSPWPEEGNRRLIGQLAGLHFAPTATAQANLLTAGVAPETVFVTGNTVIDALLEASRLPRTTPVPDWQQGRYLLITGHRRESFGAGFERICAGLAAAADCHPEIAFVYPVHLNPNVAEPVHRLLGDRPNIILTQPLGYLEFVHAMRDATGIITDSGGIQEEAPSLGKPVLVMRASTERPEAVAAGAARLVGTDPAAIQAGVADIISGQFRPPRHNPFGNGQAATAIATLLASHRRALRG